MDLQNKQKIYGLKDFCRINHRFSLYQEISKNLINFIFYSTFKQVQRHTYQIYHLIETINKLQHIMAIVIQMILFEKRF
jgi:hypothetical protein